MGWVVRWIGEKIGDASERAGGRCVEKMQAGGGMGGWLGGKLFCGGGCREQRAGCMDATWVMEGSVELGWGQ